MSDVPQMWFDGERGLVVPWVPAKTSDLLEPLYPAPGLEIEEDPDPPSLAIAPAISAGQTWIYSEVVCTLSPDDEIPPK